MKTVKFAKITSKPGKIYPPPLLFKNISNVLLLVTALGLYPKDVFENVII
jgi:hypothetical protein